MDSVSVIIPTLNEVKYLQKLLKSLKQQTLQPKEIIIVDAFSEDGTRELAREYGCRIIDGGLPAKARNAGAKAATSPYLIFLDADVVLPLSFLKKTLSEMQRRNLDIASCYVKPLSRLYRDRILHEAANYYLKLTKTFHPHIPGFCIFVKKSVHKKIGGFDERLFLAEDHDYVKRAKKVGKFSYLTSHKVPVSVRRLSEEGRIQIALKYVAIEIHLLLRGKITKNIFNYQFGNHFK